MRGRFGAIRAFMSTIDLLVVAAYFALVFGTGAYFFRPARTSRSYFLADRRSSRSTSTRG